MRLLFAVLRAVAGILGIAAVVATFAAAKQPVNPFNFFGYFTIQGNILFLLVMLVTAGYGFAHRAQPEALFVIRGAVATYMIIVGLVYNTLLVGLEGGVAVPWANVVLHVVLPIFALVDWVLFGDRPALGWRRYPLILIYPLVWLGVVLIRVGTDGMSFYPFLDFTTIGGGATALYCIAIAIGFAVVGAGVWAVSRAQLLRDSTRIRLASE